MNGQRGKGIYAQIGAAAVIVVAVLVGALYWDRIAPGGEAVTSADEGGKQISVEASKAASPSAAGQAEQAKPSSASPTEEKTTAAKDNGLSAAPITSSVANSSPEASAPSTSPVAKSDAAGKTADKTVFPSFDLVRIEPSGENVIAGRGAPGATIEMMKDGEVYARTVADPSGLFALVAPALPVGPSQIYLQSIAPDGARERSMENVTVLISNDRSKRPLVALASPDKPTVILSNPDTPDSRKSETASGGNPVSEKVNGSSRPDVRIVSVEAAEGGRLFVSGLAAPGAAVKLYLNGTLVAPGGADSEGKLSFAIARGMIAGEYQVRLDDVDPVSGQVKSKAEVVFRMPGLEEGPSGPGDARNAQQSASGKHDTAAVVVPSVETATVNRGDSLWRISQRTYGTGYRYTEIYDANQRKIRHPDLIFPGQVFVLPRLDDASVH